MGMGIFYYQYFRRYCVNDGLIYMTREGYDKLQDQINHLKTVRRKEISMQLHDARAHGDLGENAEYEAAKEVQTFNEIKIAELETKLAGARIMSEVNMPLGKALLGTTVSLRDSKTGEEIRYKLVSELEADFAEDKISVSSPVGKGLLGHKEGEIVEIKVPAGTMKYEILKIERTA
jgi:transcription elongation factor GreA